jgi:hypothetical protein
MLLFRYKSNARFRYKVREWQYGRHTVHRNSVQK